jgi:predicted phage terminase large subunit-like protein
MQNGVKNNGVEIKILHKTMNKSELNNIHTITKLCNSSYAAYVYYVHHGAWSPGRFSEFLCDRVQEFIERPPRAAYEILVLSTPPQHGKSMTVTETLPSWINGKWPDWRVIMASYNDDSATKFGRRNRRKVEEYGGEIFGIRLEKASDREYEIADHRGGVISRGIMSGITGNPAEVIIIDDPVKNRQEADSETYRDRMWDEWQNSIKTRLQAGGKVILIQTRWHEDDLAGRIIQREQNVEVINIPCEAEANDPLGRMPGEALFPEIGKGNAWLAEFKQGYTEGTRAWNALFQGRPSAEEGNILKREWWRKYTALPSPLYKIISVDAAFKDEATSDYVAIEAWGKHNADSYLLDLVRARMDFPATVRAIRAMCANHPTKACVLVEDKANGSAIIQVLRREIPGMIPVQPIGGKIARVNAIAGYVESGNVWVPEFAPYTDMFIDECAAFPNGANDDMVDSMSQALNRLYFVNARGGQKQEEQDFFKRLMQKETRDPLGRGGKVEVF